jgi:hypothetical protein
MSKLLQGECAECGGHLEFPADAAGTTANCPHCGKPTELLLALPPQERTLAVKTLIYTGIAILILIGGLVGVLTALKRAERERDERVMGRNPVTPVRVTNQTTTPAQDK